METKTLDHFPFDTCCCHILRGVEVSYTRVSYMILKIAMMSIYGTQILIFEVHFPLKRTTVS